MHFLVEEGDFVMDTNFLEMLDEISKQFGIEPNLQSMGTAVGIFVLSAVTAVRWGLYLTKSGYGITKQIGKLLYDACFKETPESPEFMDLFTALQNQVWIMEKPSKSNRYITNGTIEIPVTEKGGISDILMCRVNNEIVKCLDLFTSKEKFKLQKEVGNIVYMLEEDDLKSRKNQFKASLNVK